jgi:hypothetical protein
VWLGRCERRLRRGGLGICDDLYVERERDRERERARRERAGEREGFDGFVRGADGGSGPEGLYDNL